MCENNRMTRRFSQSKRKKKTITLNEHNLNVVLQSLFYYSTYLAIHAQCVYYEKQIPFPLEGRVTLLLL